MTIIEKIEREQMRLDIPAFKPGDAVKVHFRIVEGEKERIQVFQGNVIRMHRGTVGATVTVRKVRRRGRGTYLPPALPLHRPHRAGDRRLRAPQPSVLPPRSQG